MPDGLPNVPRNLLRVPREPHQWLIDEWHRAWRLSSVQAALALVAFSLLQLLALPRLGLAVPLRDWPWVAVAFSAAIVVARIAAQPDEVERLLQGRRAWLIDEWHQAHHFLTVRAAFLLGLFCFLQDRVLPQLSFAVPPAYLPWVTAATGLVIAFLRLVREPDWRKRLEDAQ